MAKDFREFIRICGMTHVRTSPYHPQSNGNIERRHGTPKARLEGRAQEIFKTRYRKLEAAREARKKRGRNGVDKSEAPVLK